MKDLPILIVDDEDYIIKSITHILRSNGYTDIHSCSDGREVMPFLEETTVSAVLLDLTMPHISGFTLLEQIHKEYPEIPVIIITGTDEIDTAINCMKAGAVDYFVKPVEESKLIGSLGKVLTNRQLQQTVNLLKQHFLEGKVDKPELFSSIVTRNREMENIFIYLETIAKTGEPVLITGETGTGKELLAEAVHNASGRKGSFVTLNIAGLDDTMFSDTLFGHKKGAYTGATETRRGLIEQASEGTLFLDEIGDAPLPSQLKLLRLLENGEYYPLGSDVSKRANIRVVLATNKDMNDLLQSDKIRKDFFYRISIHSIHIPPLRQRQDDLPLLIDHFAASASHEFDKPEPEIPGIVYSVLRNYSFPGNVRELRSIIYDAVGRSTGGVLNTDFIGRYADDATLARLQDGTLREHGSFFPDNLPTLKEMDRLLIQEALRRSGGNQAKAAKILGISPQALSKRLKYQQ